MVNIGAKGEVAMIYLRSFTTICCAGDVLCLNKRIYEKIIPFDGWLCLIKTNL